MRIRAEHRARARIFLAIWLALAALLLLPATANAQYGPPPPRPVSVDERGVNLASGKLIQEATDVAIGPADHHGLRFSREWVDTGWRYANVPTFTGTYTNPIISFNGHSVPFFWNGSAYEANFEDGSTFDGWTYKSSDGTQITFGTYSGMIDIGTIGIPLYIIYPDGTKVTFNYTTAEYTWYPELPPQCYTEDPPPYECGLLQPQTYSFTRLSSITSSTGYQIKLTYSVNTPYDANGTGFFQPTKATAINNAIEYCSPTAATCSLSGTWPEATYGSWIDGKIASVADPVGRTTYYSYSSGNLTGIQPPGASSSIVTYSYGGGKVTSAAVAGGTWNYYYYLGYVSVVDPNSQNWYTTFNSLDQITSKIAPGSLTTSYEYCTTSDTNCPEGLLKRVILPELNYTRYEYDTRGNVICTVQIAKSPSGDLTCGTTSTASKLRTRASYPSSCADQRYCNKPEWTEDGRDNRTHYNYDTSGSLGTGNLLSIIAPAPSGTARPITVFSYANNKQAYYKNSGGSIVASGLNISLPIQVSSCQTTGTTSGTTTSLPCSGSDERRTTIDYGPQTAGTANNLNPLTSAVSIGGSSPATSTFTYDNYGRPITVDGPLSADTSSITYNLAGQVVTQVAPDPDDADAALYPSTHYHHDAWGHVDRIETGTVTNLAGSGWSETQRVEFEFDASTGRLVRQKAQSASGAANYQITDIVYDALSRVQCKIVRMDMSSPGSIPTACNSGAIQTGSANGADRMVYNSYDALGRVWKVTSAYTRPEAADDQTLTFTANGQLSTMKDAESNLTTYAYDGHDRLVATYFPVSTKSSNASAMTCPSGPCDREQVAYDANSNVTSFTTRRGETLNLTYDNLNRLTVKDVPARLGLSSTYTRDVYYSYDLLSDLTNAMFDSATGGTNGEGVTNHYDALGRLTDTTLAMDGTFSKQLQYQYDVAGSLTRLTHPDSNYINYYRYNSGMFNVAALNATPWLFAPRPDAQGRPYVMYRWGPAAANWTGYTVNNGFDAISRVSSVAHVFASSTYNTGSTFTYNPASQITSRTQSNDLFAWTGAANVNRSYTSNGLNQYSAVASTSYSYDANGNLTSDGTNTYVFDVENRLVSRSGGASATMRYDPLGRLYEVVGSATTRFLYDGSNLIAEYDSSGNLLRRYVHGMGVDQPLVWFEGSGVSDSARRYLYGDERGSIIAVTDSAGSVLSVNAYDEYGIPNASNLGRFQYTGQAWISEMGMYYYKARMYSPTLGRFMQTDPIGYGDGANMYNYVHSDPVKGTDPSGLQGPEEEAEDDGPPIVVVGCPGGIYTVCIDYTALWNRITRFGGAYQILPQLGDPFSNYPVAAEGNAKSGDGIEEAANMRDRRARQLAQNVRNGRGAEEFAKRYFELLGFKVLAEQLRVRDNGGNLRIIDLLIDLGDNHLMGIEIKYGDADRTGRQELIDTYIELFGATVVSRVNQPNFEYGQTLGGFPTAVINIKPR